MKEYDLITLGGGSGASGAANRAAEYGAKVAVIENDLIGGTCVNRGCVPKKLTWYAASLAQAMETYGPNYGFKSQGTEFSYPTFIQARDAYVGRSRKSYENNFLRKDIDIYRGSGRFISNHEIQVGDQVLYGKYIIIATGKHPASLKVEGAQYLENSDDVFQWTRLPKSVLFIGAGYIAVELAQAYQALGVETYLACRYDRPLRKFDRMLSDRLLSSFEESGLNLMTDTNFEAFRKNDQGLIECLVDGEVKVTVEKAVVAIGRAPNTSDIGLEKTDIKVDDRGLIQVDAGHQTAVAGVYALGDVIDRPNLTPVAIRAGRQVAEYLFNHAETSAIDYENIPTVIFSHPPIGSIGLSQEEAIEKYGQDRIKIYQTLFYSMYASAGGQREAVEFKLVCLDQEEKVIGLHGIGQGMDEILQGFALAIKMGATKKDFDSVVAIHPTGAEEFVTMR